jgi:hypothetical protein
MRRRIPRFLSRRRAGIGRDLRGLLASLWRWSQKGVGERRVAKDRARFWAEVREGEYEADARSRPGKNRQPGRIARPEEPTADRESQ